MHAQFLSGYSRCLPSLFCAAGDASFPLRAAIRKCFGDAPRFNGPWEEGRVGWRVDLCVSVLCACMCVYACVNVYVCMHVCICACKCVCACMCLYA